MGRIKDQALTTSQIHQGYQAALRQGNNLFEEAKLLATNELYPGALHRLVICLEEIGKARLLFYQGALLAGEQEPGWKAFWKEYYSHQSKLDTALTWLALTDVLHWPDPKAIEFAISAIKNHAKLLDLEKQGASYSEPSAHGFSVPDASRAQDLTLILLTYAQHLLELTRSSELETDSPAEFGAQLLKKFQYATALKYVDTDREAFFSKIAVSNQPLYLRDGALPNDQAFIARVAERYEVIPNRIPVTLKHLSTDPTFAKFYHEELKRKRGYPDWMILAVLFNLALNARVPMDASDEQQISGLMQWAEDPEHDSPLPIERFVDLRRFEQMMDTWLVSFLAGLGIALDDAGTSGANARYVAAKHYGLFDRDVPHDPLISHETRSDNES